MRASTNKPVLPIVTLPSNTVLPLTPKVLNALAAPVTLKVPVTLAILVARSVPTLIKLPLTVVVPILRIPGDKLEVLVRLATDIKL